MSPNFIIKNKNLGALFLVFMFSIAVAQSQQKWSLLLSLGVNDPIENDVKSAGYYSYYVNFPTVNLGLQYMFSQDMGARLDYGFNRSSNGTGSQEFKLNYNRINAQLVYNFSPIIRFVPEEISIMAHAGPGYSMSRPLGDYSENEYNFLNAVIGAELHYRVSKTMSVFSDLALVYSFSKSHKYEINQHGFSFNGDLIYLTFGVSYSLGGNCGCL